MKSKTSCFNKTIFKKNITHFWPIWLIILLWNLFILPLMIYNNSLQYRAGMQQMGEAELVQRRISDIASLIGVYVSPGILFAFSLASAMAVFSYLYTSRAANMIHALPVTKKELFITNYISGLLFLIVPEAAGFLTGTLVSVVCGYTSMDYMMEGLLIACGISFFFYSFTVWIAMFTGQLFAIPIFAMVLNYLFVGCKLMFSSMMSLIVYGFSEYFTKSSFDVLSPLFYLASTVRVEFDYTKEYAVCLGIFGADAIAGYALAAVVCIFAAYVIYQKRGVEMAGSLISIPWINPVFRWSAAFCGGILFGMIFTSIFSEVGWNLFGTALVSAVLFGLAFFFGAQMFLEKGFRVFKKKRLIESGFFAGMIAVVLISVECDFFGIEKKIPDISNVESAYLTSRYAIGGKEEQEIARVMDLHSQIIRSKKEFEAFTGSGQRRNSYNDGTSVRLVLTYRLKNGTKLSRYYWVPATRDRMRDTETVIGKIVAASKEPKVYLGNLFGNSRPDLEILGGTINLPMQGLSKEYMQRGLSEEQAQKIYQAVIKDVNEGNFERYINQFWMDEYAGSYDCTIDLEYYNNDDSPRIYDAYMDTYGYRPYPYSESETGYCSIRFDKNCRNIIDALVETGMIESERDLMTVESSSLDAID